MGDGDEGGWRVQARFTVVPFQPEFCCLHMGLELEPGTNVVLGNDRTYRQLGDRLLLDQVLTPKAVSKASRASLYPDSPESSTISAKCAIKTWSRSGKASSKYEKAWLADSQCLSTVISNLNKNLGKDDLSPSHFTTLGGKHLIRVNLT